MAILPISTTGIDVDELWASIHESRTVDTNLPVYSTFLMLIPSLLALSASNTDSKTWFSMIRKCIRKIKVILNAPLWLLHSVEIER